MANGSRLSARSSTLVLVTAVAMSMAAPVFANAPGAQAAPGFDVTIVNDCRKDVDARFVVIPPGTPDEEMTAKAKRAPPVRLRGRARVVRSMVPNERLIIVDRSTTRSAWFSSKADGAQGLIRIGADCKSISTATEQ